MGSDKAKPLPAAAFGRLVLILSGTVWLAVGVPGLLDPKWLADLADIDLTNTMALFEFRAQFGGLSLAIAVLHYIAATRTRYLVPGLLASLVIDIGLSAGRITSLAVDEGLPDVVGFGLLGVEVALIALVSAALWRFGKLTLAERKALKQAEAAEEQAALEKAGEEQAEAGSEEVAD